MASRLSYARSRGKAISLYVKGNVIRSNRLSTVGIYRARGEERVYIHSVNPRHYYSEIVREPLRDNHS